MKKYASLLLLTVLVCCASAAELPTLCLSLPSGTAGAMLVETGKIMRLPEWQRLQQKLTGVSETLPYGMIRLRFPEVAQLLEDAMTGSPQSQNLVEDGVVRVLCFTGATKNAGLLMEVSDLPESTLLECLRQMPSLDVEPAQLNGRSCYRITEKTSTPNAEKQTVIMIYLNETTVMAADQQSVMLTLTKKTLSAPEIDALFSNFSAGNLADFAYRSDAATSKLKSVRAFATIENGQPSQLRISAIGTLRDSQSASNALMRIQYFMSLGTGLVFSEEPVLAQQVLDAVSLNIEGSRLTADAVLPFPLLRDLVNYGVTRAATMLQPPDAPAAADTGVVTPSK